MSKKLSIVLYSVHWYMYMFMLKKLSLRAAVVANRSLTVTSQSICRAEWPIPIAGLCR